MIGLTGQQLATVMAAAASIGPERRDIFLQRVGAMLKATSPIHRHRCCRRRATGPVWPCLQRIARPCPPL